MRTVLSLHGFRRLFLGVATSMFGDSVMLIVLSMWVKSLTGSNGAAGLTYVWMLLPTLVAPLLGMLVDRFRAQRVLVWGNLASAVAMLPLLLVHGAGEVWLVYGVAFLYGISFVVLPAALNGLLKDLVDDVRLVEANSGLQTVKEGLRLVGPLVGAALFAGTGGAGVAVVGAVSFVAAAVVITTIRTSSAQPHRQERHWWPEMSAGVRHLVAERALRHTLVALGLVLLVLGFTEATIYAVADAFGKPVEFVSVIVSVQGVGAVVGGVTAARVVRRVGEVGAVVLGTAAMALSLALVAATHDLALLLGGVVVFGYSIPIIVVAFTTLTQRRTPLAIMGRVSAASEVVLGTPQALSIAVGSLLVTLLDYHVIYAVMAAVIAVAAAYPVLALGHRVWRPVEPWNDNRPGAGQDGAEACSVAMTTKLPV